MSTNSGKCLGICRHTVDVRRANERHWHIVANSLKMGLGIKTAELTAIGITAHVNVHCRETVGRLAILCLGKHDKSGTSSKDGQSALDGFSHWSVESEIAQEFYLYCTLTTRNNESVLRLLPIAQLAHFECLNAKAREHFLMLDKRALKS